ncbi:MAG TPA: hypothetical protein VJ577_05505 [Burkholderiaceae bacterium]|nr:hypothetical protein [Burkholderiaceae bacterium]
MMGATLSRPAVSLERLSLALYSYGCTMLFIVLAYLFYTKVSGFHIRLYNANWIPDFYFWRSPYMIRVRDLFGWCSIGYALALLPFYAMQPGLRSKASLLLDYLFSIQSLRRLPVLTDEQQQAALSLLVKCIFLPFCLNGLLSHCAVLNNQILGLLTSQPQPFLNLYTTRLHVLIMNLILLFDFAPFVVGYLTECKWLKNEVIRVDATLYGWVVCVICYPPVNQAIGQVLTWSARDMVQWSMVPHAPLYMFLNSALLVLFALYASVSVSLGCKASNLAYRGLVERGMYRIIRHPAYALKNAAWWVAALPVLVLLFRDSVYIGLFGVACLSGWTGIYALRAITEERNILSVDPAYRDYMRRVKWRFVPGLV